MEVITCIINLRKEIVAIAAFVILFIGRLVLSVAGFDNHLLQSALRNIITIAFIVPLVLGLMIGFDEKKGFKLRKFKSNKLSK